MDRMTKFLNIALAQTLLAATAAPAFAQNTGTFEVPAAFNLTVTDTLGAPVSGADVMIGQAPNAPFTGNIFKTDQDGRIELPANWIDQQPITIESTGFVRTTYLEMTPAITTLQIRRQIEAIHLASAAPFELKGNTSGFGTLKNDGIFDLGLVFQGVPRSALSSVALTSLISSEVDHMTVLGQSVDVPSNITLPAQTESYIFPVRFDKPGYRLYLPSSGTWEVSALHARTPFKAAVDAMQSGKPFSDLVNTFEFVEGSVYEANVTQPSQTLDLQVNAMRFTKSIKFTAPTYDPGLNLLAVSLANSKGSYYPTDIKNVPSSTTVLLSAPAGTATDGMVLAAYKKAGTKSVGAASDQFSAVVLPNNEQRPFDPIRLVAPPIASATELALDLPAVPTELNPIMTYAVLNLVTSITQGKLKLENKQPQWDVWAPSWVSKLTLPQTRLPTIDPSNQTLRWEAGFHAQFIGEKSLPPGPGALEKITHVSRSAVDL